MQAGETINRQCRGCGYNPDGGTLDTKARIRSQNGRYIRAIEGEDMGITIESARCPLCGGRMQSLTVSPSRSWEELLGHHRRIDPESRGRLKNIDLRTYLEKHKDDGLPEYIIQCARDHFKNVEDRDDAIQEAWLKICEMKGKPTIAEMKDRVRRAINAFRMRMARHDRRTICVGMSGELAEKFYSSGNEDSYTEESRA